MARQRLVIIGNGMASTKLVEELLQLDADRFDITVIGAEPRAAYNRVLLSPLLAGDISKADLDLKPHAWWAASNIKLKTDCKVEAIDRETRDVICADGDVLGYDVLVLATGSQAIRLPKPGMDLTQVTTFRDMEDADALMAAATPGRKMVVIGGGLLGLEAAYGLARAGADVTLIHLMDRLMERQLDAHAGQLLKRSMEKLGICVILNADTARVIGTEKPQAVELVDGRTLDADMVVCAVGVRPNTDLARASGLTCQRGICVDDSLASSDPNIFAIGECAEHRGSAYGLVEPAYAQAKILAARLMGSSQHSYEGSVLSTNLKVSGVGLFSAGDFIGAPGSESLVYSDDAAGTYKKLVIQNDRLTGAILYGDHADALWYLDLIRTAAPIDQMRADLIFGPTLALPEAA